MRLGEVRAEVRGGRDDLTRQKARWGFALLISGLSPCAPRPERTTDALAVSAGFQPWPEGARGQGRGRGPEEKRDKPE